MKKYVEILRAIKTAKTRITDTAKTEKEMERESLRSVYKSGTDAEREAAHAAYKAAEARYMEELKNNETQQLYIEILRDNAAQAFFAESIETICAIWNKYAGKPHGEKTADKIRSEIFAAVGVRVYIRNKYSALFRLWDRYLHH